jgi:branched-chain amino acid transport system ATP-binding protein
MTDTATGPAATSRRSGDVMLTIEGLRVYYGAIAAVKGLNMQVRTGEIVTLIGSNGAGKSTTLRTISGLLRPKGGSLDFLGKNLATTAGHDIVAAGICHSPEGRRIFPRMTVEENLDLGAFLRNDKDDIESDKQRVLDLFPRLKERIAQKAGTMSGGEQQMLAVGRALMGRPKLLLLDEPSMGLAPVLVDLIFDTIQVIRDQGTTVLLVEQNALAALGIADYAYVLESGQLKLEGPARQLAEDPEVTRAYLGAGRAVQQRAGDPRRADPPLLVVQDHHVVAGERRPQGDGGRRPGHRSGPDSAVMAGVDLDPGRDLAQWVGVQRGSDRAHGLGEHARRAAVQQAVGLGVAGHRHRRDHPFGSGLHDHDAHPLDEGAGRCQWSGVG